MLPRRPRQNYSILFAAPGLLRLIPPTRDAQRAPKFSKSDNAGSSLAITRFCFQHLD
jgi:hypothetical protein